MAQKKSKSTPSTRLDKTQNKRLWVLLVVVAGCFFALIVKLSILQIFDSTDKYEAQISQTVDEVYVSAPRGNIYDKNGNYLAKESSSKTVCVIASQVEPDKEKAVAENLSKNLSKNVVDMLKIVTALEDQKVEIKDNVSEEKGQAIIKTVSAGLEYTNGTLYCIPAEVKNVDATAQVISAQLELSTDRVKEYLTKKDNSPKEIKTKVNYDIAEKVLSENTVYNEDGEVLSTNGIVLKDDHKRSYVSDTFAGFVMGFTDDENVGKTGIESQFDKELGGERGVAYYQKDALGNVLPSQTKIIKKPISGQDIYLSIDSNVQSITEEALNKAVKQWKAKSGTAIVMETKTAKILGMAVAPNYTLTNPNVISDDFKSFRGDDLKDKTESEQLNEMWKNLAISFIYEPGSTFKAITAAAALEEGVVSPTDQVVCNGSYTVDGITVKCTGNHGTQTVAEAVTHSCNPGLMQIIQKLDPQVFYRYVYNFGFSQKTGIELPGEETGIINNVIDENGNTNLLDYSTMSFGQSLATTPIQILTALNAVVNDGKYIKPSILSNKNALLDINGDLGVSKQIISSETSKELREIMKNVISYDGNIKREAGDLSVGGKTGTAEKIVDGKYSENAFITSFFCFAPVDDPKYSIIVTIDSAKDCPFAGVSSAPVAIAIMKQMITGVASDDWLSDAETVYEIGSNLVPDLLDQNVNDAEKILKEKGIKYKITKDDSGGNTVIEQSIPAKERYSSDQELELKVGTSEKDSTNTVRVPDLEGVSIQFANELCGNLGFKLKVNGSGFVKSQSLEAGSSVEKGSTIIIKCVD